MGIVAHLNELPTAGASAETSMFLSVYVYRQLGMTLDISASDYPISGALLMQGPAFDRLTAEPERLLEPDSLAHWLQAFIPENDASHAEYLLRAQAEWTRKGISGGRTGAASQIWANSDREYAGAIDFRQTDGDAQPQLPPGGPIRSTAALGWAQDQGLSLPGAGSTAAETAGESARTGAHPATSVAGGAREGLRRVERERHRE